MSQSQTAERAGLELASRAPLRDLVFEASDFEQVRTLIRERAGIHLHPGKQPMVYSRLSRRVRERGHASFGDYLASLRQADAGEWQEFVNCLTTNLTAFFRESHHFDFLGQQLRRSTGPQRIWSCAASTGEEPYSIAMTAIESGAGERVSIDASDIDTRVLETARAGVYDLGAVQALGEARMRRFFLRGTGANAGNARVRPQLQSMVNFRTHNLSRTDYPRDPYDAVFCRNVLIYFDRPLQRQILKQLHGCLRPGGLLFVGHSENFTEHVDLFELDGRTVYRRVN